MSKNETKLVTDFLLIPNSNETEALKILDEFLKIRYVWSSGKNLKIVAIYSRHKWTIV